MMGQAPHPASTTMDAVMQIDVPAEERVSPEVTRLRRAKAIFLIPVGEPGITRAELRLLVDTDDSFLRQERLRDPGIDVRIPGLYRELNSRRWSLNSVIDYWRRMGRVRTVKGRVYRIPDHVPQGGLAEALVMAAMDKDQKKAQKASTKTSGTPKEVVDEVRRRKTAKDSDLEDHIRFKKKELVTADDLVAFFAIQGGVSDPHKTATDRLARLAVLGVLERVGTPGSGVYRLLPTE